MHKLRYWFKFILTYRNWYKLIINRLSNVNSTEIILRNGYKIKGLKNTPLSVVMDETFILKIYTPKNMGIKNEDIVIDIGAHVGDFSLFSVLNGAKEVYAYEPDPNTYALLVNNIKLNNIKNIIPINFAVTDKVGRQKLYMNQNDGGNSIYDVSRNNNFIYVKTTTIEQIIKNNKLNRIDFLKIDCEGSEGLIFKNIKLNTLRKINKISMEYHNNVSVMNHTEIIQKLRQAGFIVKIFKPSNNFGYIYAIQNQYSKKNI